MQRDGVVFGGGMFCVITDIIMFMVYTMRYPYEINFLKMIDLQFGDNKPDKAGLVIFGMCIVCFNNCESLDELYVTKNVAYDKHAFERDVAKPLINNSIVSMGSEDPSYRKKRKAVSSAFFRSKIPSIIEGIKKTALSVWYET